MIKVLASIALVLLIVILVLVLWFGFVVWCADLLASEES